MDISFMIPVWVRWAVGIPLALIVLGCAWLGGSLIIGVRDRWFRGGN